MMCQMKKTSGKLKHLRGGVSGCWRSSFLVIVEVKFILLTLLRHIAEILGQPSAIRECDIQPTPVPTVPAVEYNPWPTPNDPLKLTSHSMSNFQYACDLLHLVSPVLDEM